MKAVLFLALFSAFLALASARVMTGGHTDIPTYFVKAHGGADPDVELKFIIALRQRNIHVLDSRLMEISDPSHKDYGKWMTIEEINDIIAPAREEREALISELASKYRITNVRDNGDALVVTAPIAAIEKLLGMNFERFVHTETTYVVHVSLLGHYTIPDSAAFEIVEFISGLTSFPVPRKDPKTRPVEFDNENGKVTPCVLRNVYDLPTTFLTNANSSLCLAEFQDDTSFNPSDLATFEQYTDLPATKVSQIVGPYDPTNPDGESTLDVQYGASMCLNASIWFWTSTGWMYDWAVQFYGTSQVPYIVSMSWGWTESNQCQIVSCNGITSEQYVNRTNVEFLKITSRGVTLLAASGDQGAPGDANPYCINPTIKISSIFPGASPYVLAVGATALDEEAGKRPASDAESCSTPLCGLVDCSTSTSEIVCSYPNALITSGGGFSAYTPMPSWQQSVVQKYLSSATGLPPSTMYNAANRAFPDVSAVGHNYVIRISGEWELVDGTSASTPVWAGLLSLVNDERLNAGKPTLGFVNQLLYKAYASEPSSFIDITSGNNKCTESCCGSYGYNAQAGWDAVTGLGSPNGPTLLKTLNEILG